MHLISGAHRINAQEGPRHPPLPPAPAQRRREIYTPELAHQIIRSRQTRRAQWARCEILPRSRTRRPPRQRSCVGTRGVRFIRRICRPPGNSPEPTPITQQCAARGYWPRMSRPDDGAVGENSGRYRPSSSATCTAEIRSRLASRL